MKIPVGGGIKSMIVTSFNEDIGIHADTVFEEEKEIFISPVLDHTGQNFTYQEYKHPIGFRVKKKDY